jgi:hypothetical protein
VPGLRVFEVRVSLTKNERQSESPSNRDALAWAFVTYPEFNSGFHMSVQVYEANGEYETYENNETNEKSEKVSQVSLFSYVSYSLFTLIS